MTLEELRALRDVPGWSTGRVAQLLGRSDNTVRAWLRGDLSDGAADWLARTTVRLTADGGVLTVTVPPNRPPGRPAQPAAPPTNRRGR